jgi:hypothetical protein
MIPGCLLIPLPAPSLACPNARPATGQASRPDCGGRAACVCYVARSTSAPAQPAPWWSCVCTRPWVRGVVGGRRGPSGEDDVTDLPHPSQEHYQAPVHRDDGTAAMREAVLEGCIGAGKTGSPSPGGGQQKQPIQTAEISVSKHQEQRRGPPIPSSACRSPKE